MRSNITKLFLLAGLVFALPAYGFGPDDYMPDVSVEDPLAEAELIDVFSGQTHRGTYTFLSRDITTFAFQETTKADGGVVHVQQNKTDTGQWSISGNIICYDYDDPRLLQACFNIYARGNCYYHYQVSVQGRSKYGFTARSVIAGETPSCEPSLV
ncbi:hypothetical protein [Litorimonas sp. WD9-15]|uniref:hypothetical protein n=1 Tax=Litorimonas sp. WD9-15 TaxID=3418716 RepID=UPI003D031C8C